MVAIGHVQMKLVQYHSAKGRDTCSKFLKILCRNMQFSGMEISCAIFVSMLNLTELQNDSLKVYFYSSS